MVGIFANFNFTELFWMIHYELVLSKLSFGVKLEYSDLFNSKVFIPAQNSRKSAHTAPISPNSAAGAIFAPTEQPFGTPLVLALRRIHVGIEDVRPGVGSCLFRSNTTVIMAGYGRTSPSSYGRSGSGRPSSCARIKFDR